MSYNFIELFVELRGAAIHSSVFTINTPDTIVITATCNVGDSLELRDPGFWHVQFLWLSPDSFTALYNYHSHWNLRNSE
jgi:hypothetical protein